MRLRLRAVLLFSLTCFTHASLAQNLLTNPDFDTGTSGWTAIEPGNSTVTTWDNSEGYPMPGSVWLYATNTGDSASYYQCVNITPQRVEAIAYSKIDSSGGDQDPGGIDLAFHDVPNCGHFVSSVTSPTPSFANGWFRHVLTDYPLPAYTQSVAFWLTLVVNNTSGSVYMDHAGFGPAGTVIPSEVVFKNDFEA